MHKVSAYTPFSDFDIKFLNIYLENLKDKVDEIIFIYTGKNLEFNNHILHSKNIDIKFFDYPVDAPYKWPEGAIRNFAIEQCKNEWILALDVDEIIDDNINSLDLSVPCIYRFNFIPFWYDLKTIRVNADKDSHWYPNKINRLYHKSKVHYQENNNHSFYTFTEKDIKDTYLCCYHLHYVDIFNQGMLKPRDNRSGDFQKYENLAIDSTGVKIIKDDYFALNTPENIKKIL